MLLSQGPTAHGSVDIDAPPSVVWDLVTDPTATGRLSPECRGGVWLSTPPGPAVGARFSGTNERGDMRWTTECTVLECDEERLFSFVVGDGDGGGGGGKEQGATWRYEFHPRRNGGTRVTEWVRLGRGPGPLAQLVEEAPEFEEVFVAARIAELTRGIAATLAALKTQAEAAASMLSV